MLLGIFISLIFFNSCKSHSHIICCDFVDRNAELPCSDVVDTNLNYSKFAVAMSPNLSISFEKAKILSKKETLNTIVADYQRKFTNYSDSYLDKDTLQDFINNYVREGAKLYWQCYDTAACKFIQQENDGRYKSFVVYAIPKDSMLNRAIDQIKYDTLLSDVSKKQLIRTLELNR